MRCPDASACQHRDCSFGNHRHIDRHSISGSDAEFGEGVGGLFHVSEKLGVSDRAAIPGFAFEEEGDAVSAPFVDMAIQSVHRGVQRAPNKPLGERGLPVQRLIPMFLPLEEFGLLFPEGDPILICLRVDEGLGIGFRGKFIAWLEGTGFV